MDNMKIYNTAGREKEELVPIKKGEIGVYSCGPTVYSSPHVGNMYAYVCWDVLVRALSYLGYKVNWVMNITDVGHLTDDGNDGEDKMEKGSRLEGLSAAEIAKKYELEFLENLKLLNINEPNEMPRATECIIDQINLIKKIEEKGFTYKTSDGLYFDTSKFGDYGKFANLNLEKIREGARIEVNKEKKNPTDFALWKFSPKDEKRQMEWESPWGIGFPGWHIECTAMSTKFLGEKFDIHTGGEDHIPVHHTNEIAQSFGAFGHNTAKYWIHNAFITFKGSKISKSSGGLYTVKDLVKMGFDPMVFRYMVLGSHYRRGIEFSLESLKRAENSYRKLLAFWFEWISNKDIIGGEVNEKYKKLFVGKISDDLAMPEAMAVLWKMVKDNNLTNAEKLATLADFDKVLGLNLGVDSREEEIPKEVVELVRQRKLAREEKNWPESDRLRELIKEAGYLVEDSQNSCKIHRIGNFK